MQPKESIDLTSTLIDDDDVCFRKGTFTLPHPRAEGDQPDLVRSGQASIHQPMQLISLALQ